MIIPSQKSSHTLMNLAFCSVKLLCNLTSMAMKPVTSARVKGLSATGLLWSFSLSSNTSWHLPGNSRQWTLDFRIVVGILEKNDRKSIFNANFARLTVWVSCLSYTVQAEGTALNVKWDITNAAFNVPLRWGIVYQGLEPTLPFKTSVLLHIIWWELRDAMIACMTFKEKSLRKIQ